MQGLSKQKDLGPGGVQRRRVLWDFFSRIFSSPEPSGSQGGLIVYPCSGVPDRGRGRRQKFQTSSLKLLGQSKPNFMWSLLGKGNESMYKWSRSHDQDGRHAHMW